MTTKSAVAPAQPVYSAPIVCMVPLQEIVEDTDQPRRQLDDHALQQLAESIKAHGVLQPISIATISVASRAAKDNIDLEEGALYRIVAGERRWRACQLAGLTHIPAILRDDLKGPQLQLVQILENLQRADLSTPDLVRGIETLAAQMPAADIARSLGKDKAWVSRHSTVSKLWAVARQLILDDLCGVDLGHELALLHDINTARAQQLAEMIRKPPAHRGPVTRDDVRSHIEMARQMAKAEAEAQAEKAQREIATDNARGHDSTAGDTAPDADASRNRELSDDEAADELARREDDAKVTQQVQQREAQRQRREQVIEIEEALSLRIEQACCISRIEDEHTEIAWQDASGHVFEGWPVEISEDYVDGESAEPPQARFEVILRLRLTRAQLEALAEPLGRIYRGEPLLTAPVAPICEMSKADAEMADHLRAWLRKNTSNEPGERIKVQWLFDRYVQATGATLYVQKFGKLMTALGYQTKRYTEGMHYLSLAPAGGLLQ